MAVTGNGGTRNNGAGHPCEATGEILRGPDADFLSMYLARPARTAVRGFRSRNLLGPRSYRICRSAHHGGRVASSHDGSVVEQNRLGTLLSSPQSLWFHTVQCGIRGGIGPQVCEIVRHHMRHGAHGVLYGRLPERKDRFGYDGQADCSFVSGLCARCDDRWP